MNNRFKRMLEPGERILVRSTDGKVTWLMAILLLALCAVAWIRGIWDVEFLGFRFWKATLGFVAFAPLVPAFAWLWTRWRWAITDRRILKSYGIFSREIAQLRNRDVDTIRLGDRKLSVRGAACRWELTVDGAFDRLDVLYDLFGARMGDSGMTVKPLDEMLAPGETVLWRYSSFVTDILPWVAVVSGPVALAIETILPPSSEALHAVVGFLPIIYFISLGDIFATWRSRGWRAVLTDRRLLRRRIGSLSRCDAIPIEDITDAFWDSAGWELVLLRPGRRDTIFCLPWTARRIIEALERNDRGEALA